MAAFFDKKQEVLDFVLTRKGRELFGQNNFKPAYYEFYDSDITYDANNNEAQNDSSVRIENGIYEKAAVAVEHTSEQGSPLENDANGLLTNPMGSYRVGTQSAPAWSIDFNETGYLTGSNIFSTSERSVVTTDINDNFISSASLDGVNTNEERIPQFYVNVRYQLYKFEQKLKDGKTKKSLYSDKQNEDLFLTISEENAYGFGEDPEFEVELFLIQNKGENPTNNKIVKTMFFDKENFEDVDSVENYFNVLFDEEARFESNFKQKNIYSDIGSDDDEKCE